MPARVKYICSTSELAELASAAALWARCVNLMQCTLSIKATCADFVHVLQDVESLKGRLLLAIQNSEGFGLM